MRTLKEKDVKRWRLRRSDQFSQNFEPSQTSEFSSLLCTRSGPGNSTGSLAYRAEKDLQNDAEISAEVRYGRPKMNISLAPVHILSDTFAFCPGILECVSSDQTGIAVNHCPERPFHLQPRSLASPVHVPPGVS
jgi:hypothetical protein